MREMKDSRIEWIGRIPEDWELTTYRRVFNRRKEYDDKDKQVLSLTIQGVKEKNENYGKMAEDFTGHQIVKKNDLVFTPRDFDATPILSGIAPCDGCISNLYFVLYPHDTSNTHIPFYNYFMWGVKWGGDIWRKLSYGMRFSYNFQQFGALPTVIPPIDTQKRIADYLDEKCDKIDRYIEKQQQVIEKLKAYKQSVITEAVTKGLNPDVPMKDSGIEWIGMMPEHWEVHKFCWDYSAMLGKMLDTKRFTGKYPHAYIKNADVQWGTINTDALEQMDFEEDEYERYSVKPGDLMICEGGEIGKCAIVPKDFPENIYYQKALHRVRKRSINSGNINFLFYLMFCMAKNDSLNTSPEKATIAHLPGDALSQLRMPAPPIDEQQNISEYLNVQIEKIESIISRKQQMIGKLTEYKKSLIYEAVTGKLEV